MSILYGYIDLEYKTAETRVLKNMSSSLSDFSCDSHASLVKNNVAMGFLNQWITDESKFEYLPYYDNNSGLYFVCDAIIDNREELMNKLGLQNRHDLSDSRIIYESYLKWNQDCTKHLLGDFAFVIYNEKTNRVQMFRDHMGRRLIYYRVVNSQVFFSTLIKPLVDPFKEKRTSIINERYLVDFLLLKGVRHEISAGSTIYQDINYVLPASYLTVGDRYSTYEIYWDPSKIKIDKKINRIDYINEFRDILFEAVKCRLRSSEKIGIFLSGGLDSSSVACVAASHLYDQNKQLCTYTSVPLDGFKNWAPRHYIVDESIVVRKMLAAYPNMHAQFINSNGKNSIDVIDKVLHMYEQPYKSIDNSYWLDDIARIASGDGCKVMLGGFFGNATISFGTYDMLLYEHAMRLRFISFIRDVRAICFHNKINKKNMLSYLLKEIIKSFFGYEKYSLLSDLVKYDYRKKYHVEKRIHKAGISSKSLLRVKDAQALFIDPAVRNQIASAAAKRSLSNNICERDPTSDKRIVEFCLKLPYDYYFDKAKGLDRGLIRQAMRGIVPSEIIENFHFSGLQAVDWLERLDYQWEDFIHKFKEELSSETFVTEYTDFSYLEELVKNNQKLTYSFEAINNIREILVIYACNKFNNML